MAPADLLPHVYDELRKLAAAKLASEKPGQTLDATALVHEAFLKLGGDRSFATKNDYLMAAAQAMRRILVDHARARKTHRACTSSSGISSTKTYPSSYPPTNRSFSSPTARPRRSWNSRQKRSSNRFASVLRYLTCPPG